MAGVAEAGLVVVGPAVGRTGRHAGVVRVGAVRIQRRVHGEDVTAIGRAVLPGHDAELSPAAGRIRAGQVVALHDVRARAEVAQGRDVGELELIAAGPDVVTRALHGDSSRIDGRRASENGRQTD